MGTPIYDIAALSPQAARGSSFAAPESPQGHLFPPDRVDPDLSAPELRVLFRVEVSLFDPVAVAFHGAVVAATGQRATAEQTEWARCWLVGHEALARRAVANALSREIGRGAGLSRHRRVDGWAPPL